MKPEQKHKLDELKQKLQRQQKPDIIFPEDPVEFFQKILHINPYSYQREWLLEPNPLKVTRWCRRAGKTTVMTGSDIHYAVTHRNSVIIATMPKFQQVKEIYFQDLDAGLHGHIERLDKDVKDYLFPEPERNILQTIIRFPRTSSVIRAEVPNPFTIRGHGPRKINIDEMNFIRKDKDLYLSAILPMTLTRKVHINVASTPWNKDSIYHQMCFEKAFRNFSGNVWYGLPVEAENPTEAKFLKIWRDVLQPNGPLDPQQIEIMREQYTGDPWRWKREMECAFVDDETSFLPSSLLVKCQNEELDFARFEDVVEGSFGVGWDLGREQDPGAVAVVDKRVDYMSLIHCISFKLGTPYVSQMGYIKSLCDRWSHVHKVAYDHTGTKGMDEQINTVGFPSVEGVDFSRPSKHGLAMLLKDMMMTIRDSDRKVPVEEARRKFELPCDQDTLAELNVEQWEQPKGSEVYSFSHPEGSHDDKFWAVALAVYAARNVPLGQIQISFGKVPK